MYYVSRRAIQILSASHDNISVLHICTGGEGAQPLPSLVLVERKWMSGSFKKKKKKEKDEKDGDYNRRTYFSL